MEYPKTHEPSSTLKTAFSDIAETLRGDESASIFPKDGVANSYFNYIDGIKVSLTYNKKLAPSGPRGVARLNDQEFGEVLDKLATKKRFRLFTLFITMFLWSLLVIMANKVETLGAAGALSMLGLFSVLPIMLLAISTYYLPSKRSLKRYRARYDFQLNEDIRYWLNV